MSRCPTRTEGQEVVCSCGRRWDMGDTPPDCLVPFRPATFSHAYGLTKPQAPGVTLAARLRRAVAAQSGLIGVTITADLARDIVTELERNA